MTKEHLTAQSSYKAHAAYASEHPEWMQLALEPINAWGTGSITLTHAVALALRDAYERGKRGEYPKIDKPVPTLIRRQRVNVEAGQTRETARTPITRRRR